MKTALLVDATVRFPGVCFTSFTPRGEALGINFRVIRPEDFTVLRPAAKHPFAVPRVSAHSLRPFRRQGPDPHRQLLSGTVTSVRAGEFFHVQMKERAVRVNTRSHEALARGDLVDAVGFIDNIMRMGSGVSLTGICAVKLSASWPQRTLPAPEDFSLILQGPEDIRVLWQASWWTRPRLWTALAAALGGLVITGGLVALLRRRIAQRSAELAEAAGPHEGHFRLTGVRERAGRIGGQMKIRSSPGRGTTVILFMAGCIPRP